MEEKKGNQKPEQRRNKVAEEKKKKKKKERDFNVNISVTVKVRVISFNERGWLLKFYWWSIIDEPEDLDLYYSV